MVNCYEPSLGKMYSKGRYCLSFIFQSNFPRYFFFLSFIIEILFLCLFCLCVRSLLDMREHCLLEFDFHDPYLRQKQLENKAALQLLPERLRKDTVHIFLTGRTTKT